MGARKDPGTSERPMASLSAAERDCVGRYCALLAERLPLEEVRLFGSAARGDMWPPGSPMHSDIDLLVITRDEVPEATQDELVNATYPLYLECGRQLSPHFFSRRRLSTPADEQTRAFLRRIRDDAVVVWPTSAGRETRRSPGARGAPGRQR